MNFLSSVFSRYVWQQVENCFQGRLGKYGLTSVPSLFCKRGSTRNGSNWSKSLLYEHWAHTTPSEKFLWCIFISTVFKCEVYVPDMLFSLLISLHSLQVLSLYVTCHTFTVLLTKIICACKVHWYLSISAVDLSDSVYIQCLYRILAIYN